MRQFFYRACMGLSLVISMTACVPPTYWAREGNSEAEVKMQLADCRIQAEYHVPYNLEGSGENPRGTQLDQLTKLCMQRQGFVLHQE